MSDALLTENDVCDAVACWLKERRIQMVEPPRRTNQQGIDIVAKGPDEDWLVEAKGETSSKPGTARYEKGFDNNQLRIHVARAFYATAKLRCQHQCPNTRVAMALPDTGASRDAVRLIETALSKLDICILWVGRHHGKKELSVTPWPEGRFE